VPNKMQHVICTGNLGSKEQYDELRQLAPNVHIVSGDSEYNSQVDDGGSSSPQTQLPFPSTRVVQIGEFRIGVIHGHQVLPWGDHLALGSIRRKMGVDILISGHTHKNEVVEHEGCYHINPGSVTGAYSSSQGQSVPSFILLAVQGSKVVCYVYELIDDDVEVSKTEFSKDTDES